jgi:hypothetical protein
MHRVQHVMMVVPVDRQVHEAQHVGEKDRHHAGEIGPIAAMRDLQLQHHDGDDDRDHAVAECDKSFFRHGPLKCGLRARAFLKRA